MKSWKILLLFALVGCEAAQHTLGMLPDEEERLAMGPWKTLIDDLNPMTGTRSSGMTSGAAGNAAPAETKEGPSSTSPDLSRDSEFSPDPPSERPSPEDRDGGLPVDVDMLAEDAGRQGCSPAPTSLRTAKVVVVLDRTFQVDLPPDVGAPQVSAAVEQYLEDPRSGRSHLGLYVVKNDCFELSYLRPDATFTELPVGASMIRTELPSSGINLAQAELAVLKAVEYADKERSEDPSSGYAVAVISDGFLFGICINSGPADLVTAFASGQMLDPPINVHLVSLQVGGFEGGQWTTGASAEALARAGGSDEPLVADLLGRPGTQTDAVNEALQQVRGQAQPCTADVLDADMPPSSLSVRLDGGELPLQVDAEGCGEDEGYYWIEPDDITAGLTLCPSSCTRLKELGATALSMEECDEAP